MKAHARRLALFFLLGTLLFAGKRTLFAEAAELDTVHVRSIDTRDREHAIDQALLARYAVDEHIGASDPVVWERLRAIFPELVREQQSLGLQRFERELMRRARELSLFEEDALLRNRLAFDAENALKSSLRSAAPSDEQLTAQLARHPERYARPAQIAFRQLFVSRQRHGAACEQEAVRLKAELSAKKIEADAGDRYGEPSNLPREMAGSFEQVQRLFGGELADTLKTAPAAAWSGPFGSALGAHLVWVLERSTQAPSQLSEVRARVAADVVEQQREAALRAFVKQLRARYRVELAP